ELELLQPARHPDRPALVPEVTLDLTDDRRGGVGGELHPAAQVEPVDRLDQADRRDLSEIVEPFASVAEPAGEVLDERHVEFHQLVTNSLTPGIVRWQLRQLREEHACAHAVRHSRVAGGHGTRPLRHAGLAKVLRLRNTIAMESPSPPMASTSSAKAVSTIQAKPSRSGETAPSVVTSTRTVISSPKSSNSARRSVPGTACRRSIAQASSTAMRRSSI